MCLERFNCETHKMNISYYKELKEALNLFNQRNQKCECGKVYINTVIQYNLDTRESINDCNAIVESNIFDQVTYKGNCKEVQEMLEIYFKSITLQILETCLANDNWFTKETIIKLFHLLSLITPEKNNE